MARREEGACLMAYDRRATTPAGMDRTLRSITYFGTTTNSPSDYSTRYHSWLRPNNEIPM
jgi:hypothetical protein